MHHLFDVVGLEAEYMIVDGETLAVRPAADALLQAAEARRDTELRSIEPAQSSHPNEVEFRADGAAWSNELVLHVLEMKTTPPLPAVAGAEALFDKQVARANDLLAGDGRRLLPTSAHPFMDPAAEMRLWPHENREIYAAFDRIFGCRGHGWANLQCVHINLPFAGDEEFARLHAAIRLVLPIIPALAASSPILEGKVTGNLDSRVHVYRYHSRKILSVIGDVIPEPVFTAGEYHSEILQRMYDDIAPYDPEKTVQEEWLNARGAIARFERNTIEIRLIDIQECPLADAAIAYLVTGVVRALAEERWSGLERQKAWSVGPLNEILRATTRDAETTGIEDADYLRTLGFEKEGACTANVLWRHLADEVLGKLAGEWKRGAPGAAPAGYAKVVETILGEGTLARRIVRSLASKTSGDGTVEPAALRTTYARLADCLSTGSLFRIAG